MTATWNALHSMIRKDAREIRTRCSLPIFDCISIALDDLRRERDEEATMQREVAQHERDPDFMEAA